MTDRDRLAADLRVSIPTRAEAAPNPWWREYADRLIALGWTRLDEERLARALAVVIAERGGPIEWPDSAAAIARAYREETE